MLGRRVSNELIQLNISAQILLAGVFPAIIVGLGIAYWLHQRRARRSQRDDGDDTSPR
jgi:hypothetical protein